MQSKSTQKAPLDGDLSAVVIDSAVASVKNYLHERGLVKGRCQKEIHSLHVGTDREAFLETADLEVLIRYVEESRK